MIIAHLIAATAATSLIAASAPLPEQSRSPPFSMADIGFTELCEPNPAFKRLIAALFGRGSEAADGPVDGPVWIAVAGDTSHRLQLDTPAAWNGLTLRGIQLAFGVERGPANYSLLFEEDAAAVVTKLNARGMKLPPPGSERDVAGLEGYARIGVSPEEGGGSSLSCLRD